MIKSQVETLKVYMVWVKSNIFNRYVFHLHMFSICIQVTSLEYTGLQFTSIRLSCFDSFGHPPPREIKDFLCTYAESWNYNDVPAQELYLQHVDNLLCFIFIKDVLV